MSVSFVPLPSRPFRASPSPLFPSGTGPPRCPPVPLHFHLGPSPSSWLSLGIGDTPSPSSSPQEWVLSLRLPSPQGRSLLPLPGARGVPLTPCHHPCVPGSPERHPGTGAALRQLITAVPGTPARVSGITSHEERKVKDCSLLTPVQCGSSRCRWDVSTFQASAVGAAAGKKPQTQLSSELRDQCKRYSSSSSSFPSLLIQAPARRGRQSAAWKR